MTSFVASLLRGALAASLCCEAAVAADLSMVSQWAGQYPSDEIIGGKPLWDQPGVQEAMRAAMGKLLFAAQKRQS
jgi:hypothetical protein